jgi:hypothetical protein
VLLSAILSWFMRVQEWGEQASETGVVREFICSGENQQSGFWERLHATARSFVLLPATSRRLGVIGTATILHGFERDDYIDNRYVN